MRCKAAVFFKAHEPLRIMEIELDPPRAGEVLVKMTATGVCHSDVHFYTGDVAMWETGNPVILGHEGAGVVEAVGDGVDHLAPGDSVILTFLPACGRCPACHTGQPTLCDYGAKLRTGAMLDDTWRHHLPDGGNIDSFMFISTFSEYSVAPAASCVKVAGHLPLETLCLLGCGFTTGFGAATNAANIKPGETVTIVGCGGLGLSAVQGARISGAGMIIAVDVHEEKLTLAKKLGATHTVLNRGDTDAVIREIQELTWHRGTDYSLEFVGFDQTHQTYPIAFGALKKAGTMFMVGRASDETLTITIPPKEVTLLRKKLHGVLFGDAQFQVDIPRYVDLFEQGQIDLTSMITHTYALEDIQQCFENLLSGNKVARQVIHFA